MLLGCSSSVINDKLTADQCIRDIRLHGYLNLQKLVLSDFGFWLEHVSYIVTLLNAKHEIWLNFPKNVTWNVGTFLNLKLDFLKLEKCH